MGDYTGISTRNYGGGASSITITAVAVTGMTNDGIYANLSDAGATGDISITASGAVSGATGGIVAMHSGTGAVRITSSDSVTATAGDAISADSGGGAITISGAHTVSGSALGITATSGGGDISILGVGLTGGVEGSAGNAIYANANGGGNIIIGGSGENAIGDVTGTGSTSHGIYAQNFGVDRSITIDTSGGAVMGSVTGMFVRNFGTGASSISITTADVTATNPSNSSGIYVHLNNSAVTGDISITSTGTVSGSNTGIYALNLGTGATSITAASVSASAGIGISTRTTAGASVTVTAGGTVSGATGMNAIQTSVPSGDSTSTPADSVTIMGTVTGGSISTLTGADTVTLAAGSTTTGITIDLGEGDDRLNLASSAFGTLDGGAGADTLALTGTGVTLDSGAHSNFETLVVAAGAGSNTLSGTHTEFTTASFNAGTTVLTGSLTLTTATVASRATLDLASNSMLAGDLVNNGALEFAGTGFGNFIAVTGDLTLNSGSSTVFDIDVVGRNSDVLAVNGGVTLGGTLVLRQASVATGTITLINSATSLTGDFSTTPGLRNTVLVGQEITRDADAFDLQLVTVVMTLDPNDQTHTGCIVLGGGALMAGGTLNCISATPLTGPIRTHVDDITINIGSETTPTIVNVPSDGNPATNDDAIRALVGFDGTVGITIDASNGTLTGADNAILAYSGGSGASAISITVSAVSGTSGHGIYAGLGNTAGTGNIEITATGAVMGGSSGITAQHGGLGGITIMSASVTSTETASAGIDARLSNGVATGDISVTANGAVSGRRGIDARSAGGGGITIMSASVTSTGVYSGIYAGLGSVTGTGDIEITASGAVSGGSSGISAINAGTGTTSITSSNSVTATAGDAISANSGGGSISISGAHTVTGTGGHGISATSSGGDISIQGVGATGGITSTGGVGIFADARGGSGGNINIGDTTAIGDISRTGTGIRREGIYTRTDGANSSITIDSSGGTVMANNRGIEARNAGSGASSISITPAAVTSTGNIGIYAELSNAAATGDIAITASGTVIGQNTGIYVRNEGSGAVTIEAAAVSANAGGAINAGSVGGDISIRGAHTITAMGGDGFSIGIIATSGGGDISIQGVGLTGGVSADIVDSAVIRVNASGPTEGTGGNINIGDISAIGDVTATGSGSYGIYARTDGVGSSITIDSSDGTVMSNNSGIVAQNLGTGASSISITVAAVTGTTGDGINAQLTSTAETGDISVTASGAVSGGSSGIRTSNAGSGAISIASSDSVTATAGSAISANSAGGSISISGAHTVLGTGGRGIFADSDGGDITIQSVGLTGGVSANAGHGIYADARGGSGGNIIIGGSGENAIGNVSRTGTNSGGGNGDTGIHARTDGIGSSITIDSSGGTVMARKRSIDTRNAGTGASSITITTAAVTSRYAYGIYAQFTNTAATGDISITATGTVMGELSGIDAQHAGSGAITITATVVSVSGGRAIDAMTTGGDIRISGAHTISAAGDDNFASGIVATSGGGDISIQGVGLTGGVSGTVVNTSVISADASGATEGTGGNINIGDMTAIGDVTGTGSGSYGISARTDGVGSSITLDSSDGTVMADNTGISVRNDGTGAISITTAAVTGTTGDGINAQFTSTAARGLLSVSASGAVEGGDDGISAQNMGTGGISISGAHTVRGSTRGIFADSDGARVSIQGVGTTGGVTGSASHGIEVDARGPNGRDVLIGDMVAIGNVSGSATARGISVLADGAASRITINSDGTVMGGLGIVVGNVRVGETSITAAQVIGLAGDAIEAKSLGGGRITISGAHTVRGTGGRGIYVDSNGGDISIQGVGLTGGVTGSTGHGIEADATGGTGGNINIGDMTAIGDVTGTGTDSDGINALTDGVGSTITIITSGAVRGGQDGIDARNMGTGGISISGAHTVSGVRGIYADSDGAPVSIQGVGLTGGVTGSASHGIQVDARGPNGRDVLIGDQVAIGNVSGSASASGISVLADGGASRVVINSVGTVTGGTGIIVGNVRAGETFITAAEVIGLAGNAIEAISSGGGRITISGAHTVRGTGGRGILARSAGARVSIQGVGLTGGVTGTASHGIEVDARGANGRDVLIGDQMAIGNVSGSATASGISVLADGAQSRIIINSVGTVTGGTGIVIGNVRAGATSITAAQVIGLAGDAIQVISSGGGSISISGAHTITGTGGRGIVAITSGGVSIQGVGLTGGVTGTAGRGIYADTRGDNGRNIAIGDQVAIGDVTGSTSGIFAVADGAQSSITINSVGTVMGDIGISVGNVRAGATFITAAQAIGLAGDAIEAISSGGGSISISGAHTVRGTGGRGIFADSQGGDISIQGVGLTGGVTGSAGHGIEADATGGTGGNINIGGMTAIGDVTGTGSGIGDSGISAQTDGADSTITIDSSDGTVMGTAHGILAQNEGTGASTISISTAIVTGGASSYGIDARLSNTAATGDISITTTGAVQGGRGISVLNTGSGATTIMVDSVSASTGIGIQTRTVAGASVTVNAGGTVSGAAGANAIQTSVPSSDTTSTPADSVTILGTVTGGGISTGVGADTVTLAAGSTTTGITINLGEGDDTLNLASANFGTLVGGAGADTLALSGTGVDLGGGAHSGFDILAATASAGSNTLSGTHSGFTAANFNGGTTTVTGSLTSTTATVASGATLNLGNSSSFTGDLTISGSLEFGGTGFGNVLVTGDLTLNAGSTTVFDIDPVGSSDADFLTVSGDMILGGTLALRQASVNAGTFILLDSGMSLSGNFEQTSGLRNGPVVTQSVMLDTTAFDVQLVTAVVTLDPASQTHTGCTVMGGGVLTSGGTLNCIAIDSATPLTGNVLTHVDDLTINVGSPTIQTTLSPASGDAIRLLTGLGTSGAVTINSVNGTIIGADNGIYAYGAGSGGISITTAAVTGAAQDAIRAIIADSQSNFALTIDSSAGAVTGAVNGIFATNAGTGGIRITTAAVTGTTGDGINVQFTNVAPGSLTLSSTGAVMGGVNAIAVAFTDVTASGTLTIDTSGVETLTGGTGAGIAARHAGTGDISIEAAAVTASAGNAISVDSAGGDISISGAHTVTGTGGHGIFADSDGGDITIQGVGLTGGVSGTTGHGIQADATGGLGGNIMIGGTGENAIGDVTGGVSGIYARTNGTDSSITIDTSGGTVSGLLYGIFVENAGTGALSITTAAVTGMTEGGINARIENENSAADVTINASGDVRGGMDGGDDGIFARNSGTGAINITAANATAEGDNGIYARISNSAASGDLEITTTGAVMGSREGIDARNDGTGGLSITAAAVTGTNEVGILARLNNNAGSGAITITTSGAVIGNFGGIEARNYGSGTTSITTASVSANGGVGILTRTTAGASITVNAGSTVSGATGMSAIETQAPEGDSSSTPADSVTIRGTVTGDILTLGGADSVTLAAGSTTTGITINLGEGDDRLDLASTAFGALDGGADADTLSISGTGITLDGGAHSNFETLIFAAGSNTLSGTHTGLTSSTIMTEATLDLAGGSSLTGDLANSGSLEVGGAGFGSATIAGDLILNAGSVLTFDTGATSDMLTVEGAVTLGGVLVLRQDSVADGIITLIDGSMSLSGDFGSNEEIPLGLRNTVLVSQTLSRDSVNFDLQLVTTIATLDPDDQTHVGCVVLGGGTLMAGGTLNCISAEPLTGTILTHVDGVTINVGSADIPTIVTVPSDSNLDTSDDAIRALVGFDGTAGITIDSSSGTLTGADHGIYAYSAGTGASAISITTASVTGTTGDGIYVGLGNAQTTGIFSVSASGPVSGGRNGISVRNAGSGGIRILSSNSVTGQGGHGIFAESAGGDISISGAHTVRGTGGNGILADSDGGDISIQGVGVTGGVTGSTGRGIQADARGATVGTGGTINIGGITAIGAVTSGSGSTGINALTDDGDSSITIDASGGAVMGGSSGIFARNTGTGASDISITSAAVTGMANNGIYARFTNAATTGDISVSASGAVIGGTIGISVRNAGSGAISITSSNSVTGDGLHGIAAISVGGDVSISGASAVLGSGGNGIFADSGGGDISIQGVGLTGGVSGTIGHGIEADARGATEGTGGNINIGDMTAIGDVTGDGNDTRSGIEARTDGIGSSITIDTSGGSVSGQFYGIYTNNYGTGALSITSADITTAHDAAIYANISNDNATGDIIINTSMGTLMGGDEGISARNTGTGAISITTATITGVGTNSAAHGIYARIRNENSVADVTINASGEVRGIGGDGISARNAGSGAVTITSSDSVTGDGRHGITVLSAGGDISISGAATVLGSGENGISLISGGGDISISGDHTVTGAGGAGIDAASIGGDVSIQGVGLTGGVTGSAGYGITVNARGGTGGNINIGGTTAIGDVTGSSASRGIIALTDGTDSTITIDSSGGTVIGGTDGIFARNYGTGAISITSAAVTGTTGDGIIADLRSADTTGDISITARGTVMGGPYGIFARNAGSGALTITAAAAVTASARDGIRAITGGGDISISGAHTVRGTGGLGIDAASRGGDISIQGVGLTGGVTGSAGHGIEADASGGGGGTITIGGSGDNAIGSVTGTGGLGITATSGGGDISILGVGTTGGVTGSAGHGISANADGGGNIIIGGSGDNAIGSVTGTGTNNQGINAQTSGVDLSITIDSSGGSVTGVRRGIYARNFGSGASGISITTADVTATTASTSTGIDIRLNNLAVTGAIMIDSSAGTVSGEGTGIYVVNVGTGATSITVDSVSASAGIGIRTRTRAGASVTVNTGGTVSGAAGANAIETSVPSGDSTSRPADSVTILGTVTGGGISTEVGADTVTLAAGSTTTGITIDLGEGADTLNLASVNFGTLDGGAGADTLALSGTGVDLSGDAHSGFEILAATANAGSNTLSGTHSAFTAANFNGGTTTLTGSLTATTATVASGATLNLGNRSSLTGDLANSGTLEFAGTGFGDVLVTGDLTLGAGSATVFDIDPVGSSDVDFLTVSGDVILGGTLALRQASVNAGSVILIDGSMSLSGAFEQTSGLRNGPVITQSVMLDTTAFDVELVTAVVTLDPAGQTHPGCTVMGGGVLASGGTLNCIAVDSATPLTGNVLTHVDDLTINVGSPAIQTTLSPASGDAIRSLTGLGTTGTVTINSASGTIIGADNGIYAYGAGSGAISITTAAVTGTAGDAIRAEIADSQSSSALTIDSSAGAVLGAMNGINVANAGTGSITITSAAVTGTAGDAINARFTSSAATGTLTVSSTGSVMGGVNGISAAFTDVTASGTLTIDTSGVASLTGGTGAGLAARHAGTGDISIEAATITASAGDAISATTAGGAISISGAHTVRGTGGRGIFADSDGGEISLSRESDSALQAMTLPAESLAPQGTASKPMQEALPREPEAISSSEALAKPQSAMSPAAAATIAG